jgi:hypothetical protein
VNAGHPNGCAKRVALNKTGHNPDFFFGAQFIHVLSMLDRSSIVNNKKGQLFESITTRYSLTGSDIGGEDCESSLHSAD